MKHSSSKNYAKHCFNFEWTLVEKIGLDTDYKPVVSNGRKVEISPRKIDMGFKHTGISEFATVYLILFVIFRVPNLENRLRHWHCGKSSCAKKNFSQGNRQENLVCCFY